MQGHANPQIQMHRPIRWTTKKEPIKMKRMSQDYNNLL